MASSNQTLISLLSIIAGPITAIFTVYLQSSYSDYKERKRAIRGLSYEIQANKGALDGFKGESGSIEEYPFQLLSSSFESFLNRGLMDNFPKPVRTEITSIYVNKRAVSDASDRLSDDSVDQTTNSIIESSEVISDYLEDYYDAWGYDLYPKFISKRFSSGIRNTVGEMRFKVRNRNSESSLNIEYERSHTRADIPDLVFQNEV